MSVDILGTSWDQCRSMVQYSFTSTEPEGPLGRTAQDGHLDSHTAPELCCSLYAVGSFTYMLKRNEKHTWTADEQHVRVFHSFWISFWEVDNTDCNEFLFRCNKHAFSSLSPLCPAVGYWGRRNQGPLCREPRANKRSTRNNRACFAHCQEFRNCRIFDLPGQFTFIVSKSSLYFLTALVSANAISRVGPRNKIGHPARRHNWLMQVPVQRSGGV